MGYYQVLAWWDVLAAPICLLWFLSLCYIFCIVFVRPFLIQKGTAKAITMSFHAKEEAAAFIIERLRETEAYKFIQSLVRESVERIIDPGAHTRVKKLSDQALITHSMIYHYLVHCGYRAAAEMMQAECYEKYLSYGFLKENVDSYEDEAVGKCLEKFKLKSGAVLKRPTVPKKEVTTQPTFTAKPDPEYEDVKKSLRDRIQVMADESVKKKEELMQREETVSDEEVDEEQEDESSGSEEKSSHSSTSTPESEGERVTSNWTRRLWGPNAHQLSTDTIIATAPPPSRPSYLPPLVDARPKPQLTSIRSIDFDIPQLEKSPSSQSIETPRHSPSPVTKEETATSKPSAKESNVSPEEVEELSDIESISGIDQLLESDRSGSISF
ncbi:hypothetical protein V3C99_003298 [Haemonchus contortus]